ncbi:MAG: TetR/AcrR family transcriptional regulator [Clostridia bacterium]
MDLRVQRTRKCIEDAFLKLREKKPIEKITVKEIADYALINKATFYNHYESVYDLSDKLENEIIDKVINNIPRSGWATGESVKKLAIEICYQNSLFQTLFSGSRYGVFACKLEKRLKEHIYTMDPSYKDSLEKDVMLTVLIYGSFHAAAKYQGEEFEKAICTIGEINEYIISKYKENPQN